MAKKKLTEWQLWEKAMREWLKKIIEWQKQHPDRDWLQAMGEAQTAEGSNPPTPPPPPPGTK